ncbi:hypothetical protein JTB14_002081 [Gonioctena quinquepunctata]|nr:hypothetical protein JTB14_002081 [Gonioctena quinquepunctata]
MSLIQFDVCTVFLYGKLNEEVYMKQPQGYEDGSDRHQGVGIRFSDYIQRLNFKKSDVDPCLCIKKNGENMLLLALYVDDGLLASTSSTDLGIIYKPGAKEELKTFSDADHGGDDTTGRSTTGVLSMYADGAISWYSQRQTSVAISTTEAEIVAASEAAREIVWLKRLFEEIIILRAVPTLMVDNEAAIKLAENPEYHRRTKHIHIRHFFVRELVLDSFIQVKKVSSEDQLADIMTKPLFKPRLQMLRNAMGLTRIIQ